MRTFQKASVGDTVRIEYNTFEEGVERRQSFEGILMKVRGSGASQSITVRRMSFGVGVERIFPVASPRFLSLKVVRAGKVRRSKLYYLRQLSGKAHRVASQETSVSSETAPAKTEEKSPEAQTTPPTQAAVSA